MIQSGNKFFILLFIVLFLSNSLFSGNKEMIEDNVKELDKMSKEAVKQSGEVPKDGIILLKADIFGNSKMNVIERKIEFKGKVEPNKKGDKNVSK